MGLGCDLIYARGNPARWWTSRSCGIVSRAPASIGGIGNFRKWISASLLVTLILIVVGVWYVTNPVRVKRLAEVLLTNVFGGPVTVQSARLSISGTLLLSGVELETAVTPGSPQPLPVFSADHIEVRFDWLSLVAGRLSATQLVAVKPTLFLVEDPATGHWNYEQLRSAPPAKGSHHPSASAPLALPVVILRDACIQWCEVHGGRIESTGLSVVDGQLVPEPGSSVYHFQIMRHAGELPQLNVADLGRGGEGGRTLVTGTWDVGNNHFSAVMEQITLTDDLKVALPRSLRTWWDEHRLRGSLSRFQVSFDNKDGLVLDVHLDGVSFVHEMRPHSEGGGGETFPVPFRNLRGSVRLGVTKPSLQVKHLTGKVMTFAFSAEADLRGLSPESPFDLALRFRDAHLSRDYPPLFMASLPVQDLLARVAPWGNFNLDLSIRRQSWNGPLAFNGDLFANNANMRFCHFPFPLHDVTGRIHFDNQCVEFHRVTARADESHVIIDGKVGTHSDTPEIDLTVSSDDVTFDDRVGACLPEQYKSVWDQFSLRGRGGFVCRATRASAAASAPVAINVTVDLEHGDGYIKMLPYHVSGATGRLVFTADKTLVQNLTVHSGEDHSGMLTFNGVVKHPHGDVAHLMPELELVADVPIDRELIAQLPAGYAEQLKDIELAGRVGFSGMIRRTATTAASLPAEIVGDLTLKNASLNVPAKQLKFEELSGKAHIASTVLSGIALATQTSEGLHLTGTGSADLAAGAGTFRILAAGEKLPIPEEPPLVLPESARGLWAAYRPAGTVDVSASVDIAISDAIAVKDWSLTITPKVLTLSKASWPESIHDIVGTISANPRKVTFDSIHGVTGPVSFRLNGSYEIASGRCILSGSAVADESPVQWYSKLPAGLADFLSVNKLSGQFQLTVNRLERAAPDSPWVFDGTFNAASAAIQERGGPSTSVALSAGHLSANVKGTYDPSAGLDVTGTLAAADFAVSGKNIETVQTEISAAAADKSLKLSNINGKVAGGELHGNLTVQFRDNPGFQGELTLHDASLAELALPKDAGEEERKKIGDGRVTATLALQQTFGDTNGKGADRTGRGDLIVRDGKMYNVPLAMGLMQVATLRLPVSNAFNQASMTYYLRDNHVVFEKVLLESPGINLGGNGSMSLKTVPPTLDLSFVTESPHEMQIPLVTDIFRGARNELLQIAVTGPLDNPKVTPVPLNPVFSAIQALLKKPVARSQ